MAEESSRWETAFALLCIGGAMPVWMVEHLPFQDLPQHLAAIRILHDYGAAELGFSRFFEIHLGRTQYLTYYVLTSWLSHVVSLLTANKLVVTAALVGLPFSVKRLLSELGRDWRMAFFALPLVWNAHLLHGFVNFAAALPLAVFGVSLAVGLRREWNIGRAGLLAFVALLCFYTHVVPFGILVLGVALVSFERDRRATLRRLSPLAPSLVAVFAWLLTSPAASTLLHFGSGAKPEWRPLGQNLRDTGHWLFDVLATRLDGQLVLVWGALLMVTLLSGGPREDSSDLGRVLARRLSWIAPLCIVLYLALPASLGWIWPINARFPLIAALFFLPGLEPPKERVRPALFAAAGAVSVALTVLVGWAFHSSAREETAGIDRAIASIPPGQKVAGLIFDRSSKYFNYAPFLHSVALYQAARGGAVMYTFALVPSSPVSFKPDAAPPPVPPRWEWTPERVRPVPNLDYYDYVLTRGDPGVMPHNAATFERVFDGNRWAVWKRKTAAP